MSPRAWVIFGSCCIGAGMLLAWAYDMSMDALSIYMRDMLVAVLP